MATLLSEVSSDTTGTGASHSGACTVFVRGDLAGGTVLIQVSDDDTNYVKPSSRPNQARFKGPGSIGLPAAYGAYYVRAILEGATAGSASVTVVTTQ